MRCHVCSEPWEMDTLHDEVAKRYPDKPWLVDTKPEYSTAPDVVEPWCAVIIAQPHTMCWERAEHPVHAEHAFVPQVSKSYKSWNYNPLFLRQYGKWSDQKIYESLYEPIAAEFRKNGCTAFGVRHNDTKGNPLYAMIYDTLGDDMDGAEAEIEDAEYMGLI